MGSRVGGGVSAVDGGDKARVMSSVTDSYAVSELTRRVCTAVTSASVITSKSGWLPPVLPQVTTTIDDVLAGWLPTRRQPVVCTLVATGLIGGLNERGPRRAQRAGLPLTCTPAAEVILWSVGRSVGTRATIEVTIVPAGGPWPADHKRSSRLVPSLLVAPSGPATAGSVWCRCRLQEE